MGSFDKKPVFLTTNGQEGTRIKNRRQRGGFFTEFTEFTELLELGRRRGRVEG